MIRKEDGAGGKYMFEFLKKHIFPKLDCKINEISLSDMEDSTDFHPDFVFTTDSYVVDPPFFPGGNIGTLAVCGTSNDLAVVGAKPRFMSLALVIQDGFPTIDFEKIIDEVNRWCKEIGVRILTGDTKVVESNLGIIINTAGIGERCDELENNLKIVREYRGYPYRWIRDKGLEVGDAIIVSGNIAEHGAAIMARRLNFDVEISSDVYPVWKFVEEVLKVGGIVAMKDPTRGGLAATLNEMAEKSGVGILIEEERIPIRDEVLSFCELLGLDPLTMANEGKVVMGVIPDLAEDVLKLLRKCGQKDAEIIGYATGKFEEVVMETRAGTQRVVPQPVSDPIPRVC